MIDSAVHFSTSFYLMEFILIVLGSILYIRVTGCYIRRHLVAFCQAQYTRCLYAANRLHVCNFPQTMLVNHFYPFNFHVGLVLQWLRQTNKEFTFVEHVTTKLAIFMSFFLIWYLISIIWYIYQLLAGQMTPTHCCSLTIIQNVECFRDKNCASEKPNLGAIRGCLPAFRSQISPT